VTDVNGDGLINEGDIVNYVYEIINTGNVPLSDVTVTDVDVDTLTGSPVPLLGVGASDTTAYTATRVITAADVLAGGVEGSATVVGTAANGDVASDLSDAGSAPDLTGVTDPAGTETPNPLGVNPNDPADNGDDPVTVLLITSPAIELLKSIDSITFNGDGFLGAGDVLNYTFTVTNTGDVDLTNVTVTDPLVTVAGGPIALLEVGESDSTTFTATYTLTAADIAAGGVENVAETTGTDPTGKDVTDTSDTGTDPDGATVPDPGGTETPNPLDVNPNDPADPGDDPTTFRVPQADLKVEKSVDDKTPARGDTLTYTIKLTNLGPDAAADPKIVDVLPAGLTVSELPSVTGWTCTVSGQTMTCDGPAALSPSAEVVFTYEVEVADDADRGKDLKNTVTASSSTPDPNPNNNTDDETVKIPVPGNPVIVRPAPKPQMPFNPPKPKPKPVPPTKPLAHTGSTSQLLVAASATLVLLGGYMVIFGRRRRDDEVSRFFAPWAECSKPTGDGDGGGDPPSRPVSWTPEEPCTADGDSRCS